MRTRILIRLRKKAEEATTGVADEQLRIVAFEVILRYLLKEEETRKPQKPRK